MRVLGIDPGLAATGYGFLDVVNNQPRLIETGTIEPRAKDPLPERVHAVFRNLEALIEQHHPDVMILEKLYTHFKHPTTACIMGHVRGVICLVSARHRIKFEEHSVKRIRRAVVGNGNASKQQTRSVVAHILQVNEEKLTLDASDALALALGYIHLIRHPL